MESSQKSRTDTGTLLSLIHILSLRKILALTLKNGARMAEAGEFTKRAFLNLSLIHI